MNRVARTWLPPIFGVRTLAAVAIACYILLGAAILVTGTNAGTRALVTLAFALAPPALYLFVRFPMIFPFALYVVLIPADSLLAFTKGLAISHLVGVAAAVAMIARMLIVRRVMTPPKAWFAWLAVVAWMGISLLWTIDPNGGKQYFGSVLDLFLMMTIVAVYPLRRVEFDATVIAVIATGVAMAAYTLHSGNSFTPEEGRLTLTTASGLVVDPNYFSSSFVLPIAFALATAFSTNSLFKRVACVGAVLIMMVAVLMSGSRGGFIAVLLPFGYFAWRSRHRILVALAAVGSLGMSMLVPTVWDRFTHDPSSADSGSGRTFIWNVALHSFSNHWLVGAGVGSFPALYDRWVLTVFQPVFQGWHRPSHSLVVGTLTETGIIGLTLVLTAWFLTFRQARVVPKGSDLFPMRLAIEATILGLFAQSMFIDPYYIKYIWLANMVPLMLANLVVQQRSPVPSYSRETSLALPLHAEGVHSPVSAS